MTFMSHLNDLIIYIDFSVYSFYIQIFYNFKYYFFEKVNLGKPGDIKPRIISKLFFLGVSDEQHNNIWYS